MASKLIDFDLLKSYNDNIVKPKTDSLQTSMTNLGNNKVDKVSTSNQIYGTDNSGNQTTYNIDNFSQVNDVKISIDGVSTSIVENKIATILYETGLGSDSSNTATVTAIRAFVNSSIEAVAAYYITSDTEGNAFATKSALDAGPWYYAGNIKTPSRNDYAIVVADETHSGNTARYTYVKEDSASTGYWNFQYTFNMQFTQAQINALNSGITAAKVALYDSHLINVNNPHSVTAKQVQLGNVVNTGDSATPIENGTTKFTTGGAYTELNKKVDKTTTVNSKPLSSNIVLDKTDIGLGNVNNTSDVDKPISTATQTALNNKSNATNIENGSGQGALKQVNVKSSSGTEYINEASGSASIALGKNNKGLGNTAFVIGQTNINGSDCSFVSGNSNEAGLSYDENGNKQYDNQGNLILAGNGAQCIIGGNNNKNNSNNNIISGVGNKVSTGGQNITIGEQNVVTGSDNITSGLQNTNNGQYNIVGGRSCNVSANYGSTVGLGLNNTVNYKTVCGKYNEDNNNAVFEVGIGIGDSYKKNLLTAYDTGAGTAINGYVEVAFDGTTDKSIVSRKFIVDNLNTKSDATNIKNGTNYGSLINLGGTATGYMASAFGELTQATNNDQFVVGIANNIKDNTLFVVGNGSSDTNRSNAFEVYKDSRAKVYGIPTENNDVVRKLELDTKVDSINGVLTGATIAENLTVSGDLTVNAINVTNNITVPTPSVDAEATNKSYVDTQIATKSSATNLTNGIGTGSIISANINDDDRPYTTDELPIASGHEAFAYGKKCQATGKRAVAWGNGNTASGNTSFAIGQGNTVSGNGSFAGGKNTEARGNYAFAFGDNSYANNTQSCAIGGACISNGLRSFTQGFHSVSGYINQMIVGQYNSNKVNTLFEVGNGTADTVTDRSNAFEVYQDGRAKVSAAPIESTDVVRKQELDTNVEIESSFFDNLF